MHPAEAFTLGMSIGAALTFLMLLVVDFWCDR